MDKQLSSREDYVRKVLEAYRNTPGTCGNLRRPDRLLAVQLYQRGIPLHKVENALVLAAVRRMIRPADAPPLTTVRSLAYFMPVIEEVLETEVSDESGPWAFGPPDRFRNLIPSAEAGFNAHRLRRQAMVDGKLVPLCPLTSMTSAAAKDRLVACRPCKRPGSFPLVSLLILACRAEPGSNWIDRRNMSWRSGSSRISSASIWSG